MVSPCSKYTRALTFRGWKKNIFHFYRAAGLWHLTQILRSQCPNTLTIYRRYVGDFWEFFLKPSTWRPNIVKYEGAKKNCGLRQRGVAKLLADLEIFDCRLRRPNKCQKTTHFRGKETYYMRTFESLHRRTLQTKPVSKETYYRGKRDLLFADFWELACA